MKTRRTTKIVLAAAIVASSLLGPIGAASADPIDDFCDGPRDGKAIAQRTLCPILEDR